MAENNTSSKATKMPSVFVRIASFIAGVRSEYSKIIFPSRETLRKETIACILVSVVIGVLIFLLDTAFKELLALLLGLSL